MKKLNNTIQNLFTKPDRSDWRVVKFGDIAQNISERVDPSMTDAKIYVGLEHLDPDSIHIRRYGTPSDVKGVKLRVYKGDIIFGKRRAYQRKASIAEFDGICSAHAMVIRANPAEIDPDFFPFFIHSDAFMSRAIDISEGSLSPTIKWKILEQQEFSIPPKYIQKKLSEILWSTDKLETSYHNQYDNLLKTQNALATEFIQEPNDKDFFSLGDIISIEKGLTYSSTDYTDSSSGVPMINLNCFEKFGGFNLDGIKYYGGEYKQKHLVNPGDVIIAVTDITRNGDVVGYPVISPQLAEKVVLSMDCCKLIPNSDSISSNFLYYLLKTNWAHNYLYAHSNGTTVLHLDMQSLPKLKIPKIPIGQQQKIAGRLSEFDKAILQTNDLLNNIKSMRQTILNNSL